MASASADAILSVENVSVRFGGITALDGVDFEVPRGKVCGLIGPNGAGKTTLFNCLSRLYQVGSGSITFDGRSLLKLPIHRIADIGIGRTFQNLALFRTMTVRANVMVGGHCRTHSGYISNFFNTRSVAREEQALRRRADSLLDFLGLQEVADTLVSDLPFGTQKRVELARALAAEPKLLLLDEPACGLNHEEVDQLRGIINTIKTELGITILLVEHHMSLVMSVSDKVVALCFGKKLAEGTPSEIQANPDVIRAYLGSGE